MKGNKSFFSNEMDFWEGIFDAFKFLVYNNLGLSQKLKTNKAETKA
jgi:hypothetical protein